MNKPFSAIRYGLFALGACLAAFPWSAWAQTAVTAPQQLGLIGTAIQNPVRIAEMKVTYRFDQRGTGKSAESVPVQMTYRLHNPDVAQSLEIALPVTGPEGETPEIMAIFVNGQEQPLPTPADKHYYENDDLRSASVSISLPKDSDLIVDIRALQPIGSDNIPFAFKTGRGWSGTIGQGTFEAIFPFTVANWNVVLRKQADDQLIPLTYNGRSAAWNFQDLGLASADDVYWRTADLEAMAYYEQGLDRWRLNNNDTEAYAMLRRALLDMVPCRGRQMPPASWWDNNYETITVGELASGSAEGEDQAIKGLELWSADWTVPQGDDAECLAKQWRPDRYRATLNMLQAIPKDQRSSAVQQALDKHYAFMRKLAAQRGENSLQEKADSIPNTDPLNESNLSAKDRQLMADWDARFSQPNVPGQANAQGNTQIQGKSTTSSSLFASTTIGRILKKLPKLSFGTQILLFAFLALIILVIIGYIIFKWQETPTVPERPMDASAAGKSPTVPLMGMGLGTKVNLADTQSTSEKVARLEPENIFRQDKVEIPPPVTRNPSPGTPPPPAAPMFAAKTPAQPVTKTSYPPPPPVPKPWDQNKVATATPSQAPRVDPTEKNQPPKPPLAI